MSAGLRHAGVYRYLRFRFVWRGISLEYLFWGAAAATCAAYFSWFLGYCGLPCTISWRGILALAAGVMAAVSILQWRRDPEYLGRKVVRLTVAQRLSPWVADTQDPCLPLHAKDFT